MAKLMFALGLVASGALVVTALGLGGVKKEGTYKLRAALTAKQEVPKPVGAPAGATGTFTGTLTGKTLKFKLTFKGLSGKALAAHIHLGKPGHAGAVLVPLCGPCTSGVSKTMAGLGSKARDAIERGATYVNVHTQKNQGGEIRGQVKSTES